MTQVRFAVAGSDGSRTAFQRVPAWQPLATLFVSSDSEWAYWTPEGYYDASVNGHTLFGWQVNRGLYALPDFYRADQYQKTLERPAVMARLPPSLRRPSTRRPRRFPKESTRSFRERSRRHHGWRYSRRGRAR